MEHKNDAHESPSRFLILPIWLIAIYAMGRVASEASTIFLWVVSAFFLFALLDPLAQRLKARKWPNSLAAVFLVVLATAITFGLLYALGTIFSSMFGDLEQSKKILMDMLNSASAKWHSWSDKISSLQSIGGGDQNIQKVEVVHSSPLGGDMGGTIMHGLGSAANAMTFALLVPILAFFFLTGRDAAAHVFPKAFQGKDGGAKIWAEIVKSTRAFFLGNIVLALLTYPVFVLLFWIFSVPAIFTASAIATAFNLIPFLGAMLSGLLPGLTLYAQDQAVGASLGLYGCCVMIHFFVADFVTPKLLGAQVNINAATSTIALVAWGELWGGLGLILAIPITSVVKVMFENSNYFWLQWIAGIMSEKIDFQIRSPHARRGKSVSSHRAPQVDS